MARRRVWDALSESYRRRLIKGGITKEQYESGASLKTARGHGTTPESPEEYARNPSKYQQYKERRRDLVARVVEKKRLAFADMTRWNEENSEEFASRGKKWVKKGGKDNGFLIKPPSLKQLRQVDAMTVEELRDFQYEQKVNDDWRFLWYH